MVTFVGRNSLFQENTIITHVALLSSDQVNHGLILPQGLRRLENDPLHICSL